MPTTRRLLFALLYLFCASRAVMADDGEVNEHLKELAWMVGVWTAELKPAEGEPVRIETTFSWSRHKQALNYSVVFRRDERPVTQYEGLYFYHPGTKALRMLQINRQGDVTESVVTFEAGKMLQENEAHSANGSRQLQRVEVTREGDNRFRFKAAVKQGDAWIDAVAITYERADGTPRP